MYICTYNNIDIQKLLQTSPDLVITLGKVSEIDSINCDCYWRKNGNQQQY